MRDLATYKMFVQSSGLIRWTSPTSWAVLRYESCHHCVAHGVRFRIPPFFAK